MTPSLVEAFGSDVIGPEQFGGKGASLSRLVGLGHRVPPGFTIAAGAFEIALRDLGLDATLMDLAAEIAQGREGRALAERIESGLALGRLPRKVMEPVLAAVDAMGPWAPQGLIVRSSATVEDSSALSFAGIFESIQIGRPDDLEPAIRAVWASAFSRRALSYVVESGVATVPSMGVVVQRFVDADRSGVMFTRYPGPGGADRILVEHVEGGCEKLVKGEVTPDRVWIERDRPVAEGSTGHLRARHARELALLAATLEDQLGGAQDVEWCVADGVLFVVQARPITTAASGSGAALAAGAGAPIVTGTGASAGVGSGRVRLVFNIDQALALERGEVLVTPMTNPDMVVAMRIATGVVTDVGGMICHAAIVSRELGLPCVVGTETATAVLAEGTIVTVDGGAGAVYAGSVSADRTSRRAAEWRDLWSVWLDAERGPGVIPLVSSVEGLEPAPPEVHTVVLAPDVDLRADPAGLWNDLESRPAHERDQALDAYLSRIAEAAERGGLDRVLVDVRVAPLEAEVRDAVRRAANPRVGIADGALETLSLGAAAAVPGRPAKPGVPGLRQAMEAQLDTLKFFGHRPESTFAAMPDPAVRATWFAHLPEYGRYHREFAAGGRDGEFEWLQVRPELVISALLKSLVQPGFEMVPRVLGFAGIGPMHIKWIRCRYHFRADAFAGTWAEIVRATWDTAWMADLMRRVRASYARLSEVLVLFPESDEELRSLSGNAMAALITSWWPRWVEFFALCWFIQAQGDDVAYPFIEETVRANLAPLASQGFEWPSAAELVVPTTPVLSGEYMSDLGTLRSLLLEAGLTSRELAEAALAGGEADGVRSQLDRHLERWHWMRDRDLVFEPWDTPRRVIETALKTDPHAPPAYAENLRRNLLALAFHADLADLHGRRSTLNHMARFLHDLNVERENHHVLWLRYSYPLRRVFLEIERRLVDVGSLTPGEVFFLQAPELIDAARRLPARLPDGVAAKVRNRRSGFLHEAKLASPGTPPALPEDDYY